MRDRLCFWLLTCTLALGAAACDLLTDPEGGGVPESELTFVRVARDAPPLKSTVVSFYVKRGETREVQISYQAGAYNGKCLRFIVPADAPLRHPNGTAFAPGDSARVTIRVVDASRFIFEFDPAGLQFHPQHPALLEVRYRYADPDFNGDGVVDERDRPVERSFGFWRQERTGEPWIRVATTRDSAAFEARALVHGFTKYALASN